MKILHLDSNHSILAKLLEQSGFHNEFDFKSDKNEILNKINAFNGIIIRSRIPIDKAFLEKARHLKFIGRVGAGMENIDIKTAESFGIKLFNAPEGNANAMAEHVLGMLLSIMNNFKKADKEVKNGIWLREENRGEELFGKTVGIIGYGNNGNAFARLLQGFRTTNLCVDILPNKGNEFAKQVEIETLFELADVISLHVPLTEITKNMVQTKFLIQFKKPIYFVNAARGACVVTKDLLKAINEGKVKAAALDVLEYEKSSFENLMNSEKEPEEFKELLSNNKVLLTPHIAGWTVESKEKLAKVLAEKIIEEFRA